MFYCCSFLISFPITFFVILHPIDRKWVELKQKQFPPKVPHCGIIPLKTLTECLHSLHNYVIKHLRFI